MNTNTFKKASIAGALLPALFVSTAFAAGNAGGSSKCQIIYGGGEVCEKQVKFTIDKTIQTPGKGGGSFVDNLTINDPKFSANQDVNFKIVIENTGDSEISNLNVVDFLPDLMTFKSGNGSLDANKRTLSFDTGKITAGKKLEFIVTLKVVDEKNLPSNQGVTCLVNTVKATESNGAMAEDSSQACVQKQVLGAQPTPAVFAQIPVKTVPATGPELFSLFGLIPMGAAGIYFRRKSQR